MFNSQDRKPMVLNCGHTFCDYCTSRMSSCPIDRQRIRVSPKVNFQFLEMLEKLPGGEPNVPNAGESVPRVAVNRTRTTNIARKLRGHVSRRYTYFRDVYDTLPKIFITLLIMDCILIAYFEMDELYCLQWTTAIMSTFIRNLIWSVGICADGVFQVISSSLQFISYLWEYCLVFLEVFYDVAPLLVKDVVALVYKLPSIHATFSGHFDDCLEQLYPLVSELFYAITTLTIYHVPMAVYYAFYLLMITLYAALLICFEVLFLLGKTLVYYVPMVTYNLLIRL